MDLGTLRVTTPDGQVREYPIDLSPVQVGRAEGNRVTIDHVSVSRRHALLTIDGGLMSAEDLGSANGTFVGSSRLTPGVRTPAPGGAVRFGDCEALFIPAGSGGASRGAQPALAAPGQAPGGGAVPDSQQTIAVSVISPPAPVAAGGQTTATITIQNRGPVPDDLTIAITDLPPGWARVSRPQLALVPGARDEVTVVLAPPRGFEGRAGEHAFSAAVFSREYGIEIRALGRFTVLPFDGLSLELRPPASRGRFQVAIRNDGNSDSACSLAGGDSRDELDFAFTPEGFELEPGGEGTASLVVRPRRRHLFGPIEQRAIRVEARPAAAGPAPAGAEGIYHLRPFWHVVKWPVIAVLAVAAVAGGFVGYRQACGSSWPACAAEAGAPADDDPERTPTPVPERTPSPTATPRPGTTPTTAPPTATTAPAGLRKGGRAIVINSAPVPTDTNCLALRDRPAINPANPVDNVLRRLCDGTMVTLVDGTTNDGTYLWWYVNDGQGVGWVAEGPTSGAVKWLEAR